MMLLDIPHKLQQHQMCQLQLPVSNCFCSFCCPSVSYTCSVSVAWIQLHADAWRDVSESHTFLSIPAGVRGHVDITLWSVGFCQFLILWKMDVSSKFTPAVHCCCSTNLHLTLGPEFCQLHIAMVVHTVLTR